MSLSKFLASLTLPLAIVLAGCVATSTIEPTATTLPPSETPEPTPTPLPSTQTSTPEPTTIPNLESMQFPGGVVFTFITDVGPEIFALMFELESFGQLTDSGGTSFLPRWSPDRTKIAYLRVDPVTQQQDIWVWEAEEVDSRQVTTTGVTPMAPPRWSPDGRFLLYADGPGGSEVDIIRVDIETGVVTRLTSYSLWDAHPDWSPDGEQIAFVSDRLPDGSGPGLDDIWIMSTDGSNQTNLTNQPDWEDVKPAWSPDGEEIAFFRWNLLTEPDTEGGPAGLWAIKPDGSGERLLSADVEDAGLLAEPPVWSPDGSMIAYSHLGGIFVVNVEDGTLNKVADEAGDEFGVSWSPDSRAVSFSTESDDDLSLYIALADGSAVWEVFEGEDAGAGHWSSF